jgi:hypothetical protein
MTTQIQFTSSIFQLAFGVNAVFVILLNHYLGLKASLTEDFIRKLQELDPSLLLDGKRKHLTKYLIRAMVWYRIFNAYFLFCIALAVISCAVSVYYLLQAALVPDEKISSVLLTTLTYIFLVANPILYFVFLRSSEWFLSVVQSRLKLKQEDVSLVKESIMLSDLSDKLADMIAKI